MPTKGRCLCGKVGVTVNAPLTDFDSLICHCASCKRRSGGIASFAFMVPKQHVEITGPNSHVTYIDPHTGSGKPMERSMCSECGSPVRIIEGHAPDVWCLQYGLFADEVDLPPPKLELFRKKACAWMPPLGEVVKDEQ
ncbi:hypothetical protein KC333_g6617 [Hortaea werneckii]|nr:hypothetical protein KC333_g6617 [Hortaea werneckii]KAI7310711.1 hypothetical protein KC326_g6588 [Hortaea werneckii]